MTYKTLLTAVIMTLMTVACGDDRTIIEQGQPGPQGEAGVDGKDGKDGTDGQDGADAFLENIDPCGDHPNHADEILFVLAEGSIMAYFKDGGNREFLTLLTCGKTYQTTDRQRCLFRLTETCEYEEL